MNIGAARVVASVLAMAAIVVLPGLRAASAGGPYDGTYHGTIKGSGSNAVSCAKNAAVQMTVTDGRLEYHHFSNTVITSPVTADGSFSGSAQNTYASGGRNGPQVQTLSGKITGASITAETKVGGYCSYELQLTKYR